MEDTKSKMPLKEDFGFVESEGFDSERSGWVIEGGEDAYYEAYSKWVEENDKEG